MSVPKRIPVAHDRVRLDITNEYGVVVEVDHLKQQQADDIITARVAFDDDLPGAKAEWFLVGELTVMARRAAA